MMASMILLLELTHTKSGQDKVVLIYTTADLRTNEGELGLAMSPMKSSKSDSKINITTKFSMRYPRKEKVVNVTH